MIQSRSSINLSVLATVAVVALVLSTDTCQSASVGEYVNGAKDYLVSLVRDGVLNKSTVVTSFSETMGTIRERFEAKKKSGELDGKDEAEVSSAYYKIVLEEIKNLRHKFEADRAQAEDTSAADKFMESSANFAKAVKKPQKSAQYDMFDMEMDMDDDDAELNGEDGLKNQLDSLDDLERLEMMDMDMGWGLSAENRAALHERTLKVLGELVQNELKTIVVILVTSYMGGPAVGTFGPAVQAATASIKMKLMEFFMKSVMDMFAGVLGQKIQPELEGPATPTPAALAA